MTLRKQVYVLSRTGRRPPTREKSLLHDDDDVFDEIDELLERWNNRLSIHNLVLAERYLKGELKIGVWWKGQVNFRSVVNEGRGGISNGRTEDYISILERTAGPKIRINDGKISDNMNVFCLTGRWKGKRMKFHADFSVEDFYGDKRCVLVENIELMDLVKSVSSSSVGPQSADNFLGCVGGPFELIDRRLFKSLFGGTYWEVGFINSSAARLPVQRWRIGADTITRNDPIAGSAR